MTFNILSKKSSLYEHIESLQASEEIKTPLQAEDYFRASSIFKMCPRQEALYHKYKIDRKERISAALSRTFKFGRLYEKFFRDELLGDSGLLLGKWKCRVCDYTTIDDSTKPKECGVCGAIVFDYVEDDLVDKELGIGGHPDGKLLWENRRYLLELKTTNSFNFSKVLQTPMEHHVAQMQIYMNMLKMDVGLAWYFNKDTSQDICHEVQYDENQVKVLLEKPRQYRSYLSTGELPERICFNASNPRANKCAVCKLCFS